MLRIPFLLVTLALLSACVERSNAVLPPTASSAEFEVPKWEYAGSFGGEAELVTASSDAWERSYTEGKFLQLAGIDANQDELWACDSAISRIQVFDLQGRFLRSIGAGVPLEGTLPSDLEMYKEEQSHSIGKSKWEDSTDGQRWVADKTLLFKGVDVALLPTGYWLSDQMQSSGFGVRARHMACRFYANDGSQQEVQNDGGPLWPWYIAASGDGIATIEQYGNRVCAAKFNQQGLWEAKRAEGGPGLPTVFKSIMEVVDKESDNPRFRLLMSLSSGAGSAPGQFMGAGGLTYFNGKLLVCDAGNRRIQVFEGRPAMGARWMQSIKILTNVKATGARRFVSPVAIDTDDQGYIYVLDGALREVAVLSPTFERLATLPDGSFEAPFDLCLSSDAMSLFVSDPGRNQVHRYVRR